MVQAGVDIMCKHRIISAKPIKVGLVNSKAPKISIFFFFHLQKKLRKTTIKYKFVYYQLVNYMTDGENVIML